MKTQATIIKRIEIECPNCEHIFDAYDAVWKGMRIEDPEESGTVECPECAESISYWVTT